ncbi:dTMP kinase [Candidatus Kinetoplastibacterium blastocrithidii TCC012E]|uniref:Thymidylate kinase n=1 Tax=Candidatus Kinetoplastidibacterium blastocrithidiae TCC012E TaxID=1208922 RepID=M1M0H4_9PROT|nr:dTMP kinase [Candidatus Kinetoplastibacterium blastocrithidii]AFZ83650.1 thymidylate kinase [Candidatus Kinetoplastibacterium blastocrithidii (ex Strigomonas culicis)]AGF49771.1 dTMP kinase [Candidatus Kinetoplastibacterium blastocrithidii TCC012E]
MILLGKFITLEGIDGAGKSTNSLWLADILRSRGLNVINTREPGGTELGDKIRHIILENDMSPEAETMLIFAARFEHFKNIIQPSIRNNIWVICDRFIDATYAYQGSGKGVSLEFIKSLEGLLSTNMASSIVPDLTLLFDIPFDLMLQRISHIKKLDRFERNNDIFFNRVRKSYLEIARKNPCRVKVIDSSKCLENTKSIISEIINNFLVSL